MTGIRRLPFNCRVFHGKGPMIFDDHWFLKPQKVTNKEINYNEKFDCIPPGDHHHYFLLPIDKN
jgi:hypothetical protein